MVNLGNDWDKILADEFNKDFGWQDNVEIILNNINNFFNTVYLSFSSNSFIKSIDYTSYFKI